MLMQDAEEKSYELYENIFVIAVTDYTSCSHVVER